MHKSYYKSGYIKESVTREIKLGCLTYTVQLTRMQDKVKLQSFQSTLCVWYRKKTHLKASQ